jgi:hypothetical protein
MSEATATPPAAQAAPGLSTGQLFKAISEYFVALSGAAVALGILLATTFLTSYLSVFDWHLLWFVQYTDILTFGLVALGIISGSLVLLHAWSQIMIGWFGLNLRSKRNWALAVLLPIAAIVAFDIWSSVRQGQGYFHIIWGPLTLGMGVIVILQIIGYARSGSLPNMTQFAFFSILMISTAGGLGQWLGYSVLEAEKPQDITLKNGTLNGAKLIIVMSRHTLLLRDKDIFVVPTDDIVQFHSTTLF